MLPKCKVQIILGMISPFFLFPSPSFYMLLFSWLSNFILGKLENLTKVRKTVKFDESQRLLK